MAEIRFWFYSSDATDVTERLDHDSLDLAVLLTPVDATKYEYLSLGDNRFMILWPHDAHAPNHAVDGIPIATRKCVVKVRV